MPVDDSSTPDLLWTAVSDRIRDDLSPMVFGAWFSTTRALALAGDVLEVGVPNEFTRAWIEGHFAELVRRAATAADPGVSVRFCVTDGEPAAAPSPAPAAVKAKHGRRGRRPEHIEPLRSKYTFGSFVIGSSNRFAHAAALAVAEAPGQAYNPLVIYGETGLGKTHLLQAIAHYVLMHAPGMRARYVTCEAFTNEFIAAIKDKSMDAFKRRYREEFDVLLIDDIHFLAGKDGIQEEFFHTFNTLHASGRQLVLTSDRAPREIPELADRLRSRFEWGLLVDVQPPDIETRIAILHKRVAADRVRIDDPELLPGHRTARPDQHPRARGRAHARPRLRLADRAAPPTPHSCARRCAIFRTRIPRSPWRPSSRSCRRPSASRSPSSSRPSARRRSSRRGSSPCTSAASSRTRRCRRSAASSADATTRRCCTRCRRSLGGCITIAASTTRSTT